LTWVFGEGLDHASIRDLRVAIELGGYPWFRAEFDSAIRGLLFTEDAWCTAVGTSPTKLTRYARGAVTSVVRDQQRVVWDGLFPSEPFPWQPASCARPDQPVSYARDRRPGEPVTPVTRRAGGAFAPDRRSAANPRHGRR